jgi:FkbM family methyltransferase
MFSYKKLIKISKPTRRDLLNFNFLQKNKYSKLYVMGINDYTQRILKTYKVDGIIHDYSNKNRYGKYPILKLNKIGANSFILIAVGEKTRLAEKNIRKRGIKCLNYFSLKKLSKIYFPDHRFNKNFKMHFKKNFNEFKKIYKKLHDSISKAIFIKICKFRYDMYLTRNSVINCKTSQYFENFLHLNKIDTCFFDIGGYDGKTTETLLKKFKVEKVMLFEPSPQNLKKIAKQSFPNKVRVLTCGLGNGEKELFFSENHDQSKVVHFSNLKIRINKLDNFIHENPNFLKIDVEGNEVPVLKGARKLIKKLTPRIAVAVYHNPNHLWMIPKIILAAHKKYKIFLRHYSDNIFETIMYFVPKP